MGESDAGFASNPRRGNDRLRRVVGEFAALRRLMLYAPLANLLPKRQRRKLPPTSNAIRHRFNKRLSALRRVVRDGRSEKAKAPLLSRAFFGLSVPGIQARLPSIFRLACRDGEVKIPKAESQDDFRYGRTVARRTGESNPLGCVQPSNAWQAGPVPTPGA